MSQFPRVGSTRASDRGFALGLCLLGGSYIALIVGMIAADLYFTTPDHLADALHKEEIRYAVKLSVVSCTVTAILALWCAVPLGYLLSRYRFFGKEAVDTLLDIPIVLPPLVIGLSLLILFTTAPGKWIERTTSQRLGFVTVWIVAPLAGAALSALIIQAPAWPRLFLSLAVGGLVVIGLALTPAGPWLNAWAQTNLATKITFNIPAVILAQFAVSTAFAVRTMRVAFDQISPRTEQVALTLGCSRSQAFWRVTLPQARRGVLTAATLAWARALGEFGPILIFAGANRMRTEVLSTSVFLELNIGNLDAAIAVSMLMLVVAIGVLVLTRLFGLRGTGLA
jgi:molybdate transport system permease protein